MAAEKKITSRIQQKHDTAANWANATTFIPKKGEIVIYDAEYNTSGVQTQAVRFKIGDGSRTINNLPFALIDYDNRITSLESTVNGLGTAAQKDVGFFATAAQGTKADNAVPNTRKVNNKALSTDIKLEPSDVGVTESAFPGLKKTGTITGITMNGASKGTSGVVDLGTVLTSSDNLAKLDTENTFTAKQTINSGYGAVSLKTQGYVEIGASFASKSDIGGLFGYKDDGTGRIYAVVPRDLGFVERIKMNNSSIEPDNTGIVDLGTVITDVSEKANLSGGNIFSGLQTVNAPTNSAGTEQATVKFKTANGGSITFGKEGPNSGSMIRLDQTDGTCRLRFRSSSTAGAMVWEQPEKGAKLFVDLGKSGADYHRIEFPSTDGTLALTYQIPTSSTVSGWGFTKNAGTVTSVAVKMNGATKGTVTSSGTIDLGTVITNHQDISGLMPKSGGTFTGNISVPKTITFTDNTNPFIKMTTGGTDFYFQSTSGQFGLGPTWAKATHWDSNGNVTFPTVPKVGSTSLVLTSAFSLSGTTLTITI